MTKEITISDKNGERPPLKLTKRGKRLGLVVLASLDLMTAVGVHDVLTEPPRTEIVQEEYIQESIREGETKADVMRRSAEQDFDDDGVANDKDPDATMFTSREIAHIEGPVLQSGQSVITGKHDS